MLCPFCHKDIAEEAKFCPFCGNRIQVKVASFEVHEKEKNSCSRCGKQVSSDAAFCPFCGTQMKNAKTNVSQEDYCNPDLPRCPRCNNLIRKEDKVCPQCQFKLGYFAHLGSKEKKEFSYFLRSALAMAFCLIPIVSFIFSLVNIINLAGEKNKTKEIKECLVYNIIAMVVAIGLFIISLVLNLQSLSQ